VLFKFYTCVDLFVVDAVSNTPFANTAARIKNLVIREFRVLLFAYIVCVTNNSS